MPLPYVPYKLTTASLSSSSDYTHDDQPIPVPASQHPGSQDGFSSSTDIPQHHAVHAKAYFPSSTFHYGAGFVLARAVAGAKELELRWCRLSAAEPTSESTALTLKGAGEASFSPVLDNLSPSPSPKTFIFPAPLLSDVGVFADKLSGNLYVVAVTTTGYLYRLTFPLPYLFHTSSFNSGWSSEYRISHLAGAESSAGAGAKSRAPTQAFMEDVGLVLLPCGDGAIVKLQQSRSGGDGFEGTWRESVLRPTSFLSGVSRFFSRSSSPADANSSPTHALSVASLLGGNGYALSFAASRDRKLRIWNLSSESCVRTLDLPVMDNSSSEQQLVLTTGDDNDTRNAKDGLPPFSLNAKPLVKLFSPGEDDQNGYPKYLLVFIPAPLPSGNLFALYGIELEESKSSSGGVGEVTLLWQKQCDPETRGRGVELRDAAIAPQSEKDDEGWTMWTLWDSGNGPLIKYTRIGDGSVSGAANSMANISVGVADVSKDDWRTVSSEKYFRPIHGEKMDEVLKASREETYDPSDVYLSRVLEPGRFSEATLRLALQTYRDVVPSTFRQPSNLFYNLTEEIGIIVGSNCQLETDPKTGGQLHDKMYSSIVREWTRFIGLADQIESSAMWPVELAMPLIEGAQSTGAVSVPIVVMRASIALPIIEDGASIVERLQRKGSEAAAKNKASVNAALEYVNAERRLLFAAADLHNSDILPVLGSTSATVAEVFEVVGAAANLTNKLTAAEIALFVSAVQRLLSAPLDTSLSEAASEFWLTELDPVLGEEAALIVDKLVTVLGPGLQAALQDMVNLLTGGGSQSAMNAMLRRFADVTLTDLGSSLSGDALLQVVATRYSLAVSFSLLVIALHTCSAKGPDLADLPVFVASSMSILQSLNALYELARLPGIPEMSTKSAEGEHDSLAARIGRLDVGAAVTRTCEDKQAGQFESPSLLHFAVRNQLLAVSTSGDDMVKATISRQIASVAAGALNWSGLLPPGSDKTVMPFLTAGHAQFADALLQHGFPSAAIAYLAHFPPASTSHYVAARAQVYLGRLDEASSAFERVVPAIEALPRDDEGLASLLPSSVTDEEVSEPVAQYYRHVAYFFEAVDAPYFIVKFCQASIESVSTYAGGVSIEEAETTSRDLWFKIFRSQIEFGDYAGAYDTIVSLPHEGLQKDCLRSLVGVMCETGEVGTLLKFGFPGLQQEIERTLSFKARNSDPFSTPNYYMVLYSYHIFRGDLKSAGAVMYQHAHRLAELHGSARSGDPLSDFKEIAVRQAQSYLASINALSMIKVDHAWFAHATSVESSGTFFADTVSKRDSSKQKLTHYIPSSLYAPNAPEIRIVTLADIRKEYALILARLELVGRYPELGFSTSTLRPADAVLLFVNSDRFDLAFSTAKALDVDMSPIFTNLTTKCITLSHAREMRHPETDEEMEELRDADEDLDEPEASFLALSEKSAGWSGPASERAWRYVRMYLGMFDLEGSKYRVAVLDCAVALGQAEKLPDWLQSWFEANKPDLLVRALIKYGLVDAALRQSISMIRKETEKVNHMTQASPSWLPYTLFDTLLLQAENPDARPPNSSASVTRNLAASLRSALSERTQALSRRTQQVQRMGEADLERERKRREREQKGELVPSV